MKEKQVLVKILLPAVFLVVIAFWSFWADACFAKFETYQKYKLFIEIFPQCVFPYNGFFNIKASGIGIQDNITLFGWSGWITSAIHWTIVVFGNSWITRNTGLLKSFLVFLFCGFCSIVLVFFVMGRMGWGFGINGL